MEGFFDRADIMVKAMASAFVVVQRALAETPIPSPKPSPVKESA